MRVYGMCDQVQKASGSYTQHTFSGAAAPRWMSTRALKFAEYCPNGRVPGVRP